MLMSHLDALGRAELIRLAQQTPELEYLFRHALVQEAAYASILKRDGKQLHRAVGAAADHLTQRALRLRHLYGLRALYAR
jgi:predicted ATPase